MLLSLFLILLLSLLLIADFVAEFVADFVVDFVADVGAAGEKNIPFLWPKTLKGFKITKKCTQGIPSLLFFCFVAEIHQNRETDSIYFGRKPKFNKKHNILIIYFNIISIIIM